EQRVIGGDGGVTSAQRGEKPKIIGWGPAPPRDGEDGGPPPQGGGQSARGLFGFGKAPLPPPPAPPPGSLHADDDRVCPHACALQEAQVADVQQVENASRHDESPPLACSSVATVAPNVHVLPPPFRALASIVIV